MAEEIGTITCKPIKETNTMKLLRINVAVFQMHNPGVMFNGNLFIEVTDDFRTAGPRSEGIALMPTKIDEFTTDQLVEAAGKTLSNFIEGVAQSAKDAATKPTRKHRGGRRKGEPTHIEKITAALGKKSLGTTDIMAALAKAGHTPDVDNPKRYVGHILSVNSKGKGSPFARVRGQRGVYRVR